MYLNLSFCSAYVGVACVDGSYPIANADLYEQFDMDVVRKCVDCPYYRGCDDCALYDTDLCERK